MKTVFKKGMTVYWGELKGEVLEIENESIYPVGVRFENNMHAVFTIDGRTKDGLPVVLSLTPYTLNGFSQEPQIEKDTLVYVRNKEIDQWEMRYYSHFENGIHYCFCGQKKSKETDYSYAWKFLETENPLLK